MKTGQSNSGMSGSKFPQGLVDQTPVFDKRRKHNKGPKKHRGNIYRPPNYLK
jgi:hypothetical protein